MNPFGPHKLGEAFVGATECIEIDIRVRIVLLKLFERFVMEHLGKAYEDANRLLAEAGVLPDLRNVMKREATRRRIRSDGRTGRAGSTRSDAGMGGSRRARRVACRVRARALGNRIGGMRWRPGIGAAGGSDFTVLQQLLAAQPGDGWRRRPGGGYCGMRAQDGRRSVRRTGRTRSSRRRN